MRRHFQGLVYRVHHPNWAFAPNSGEGAKRWGGRFNKGGLPALYTALSEITALAEYNQKFPSRPQPATLCAYQVNCGDLLDLSDPDTLKRHAIDRDTVGCSWEIMAWRGQLPPSWALADRLIAEGIAGVFYPSLVRNAPAEGKNLVFWDWADQPPHQVIVIDDFNRLPKKPATWESED